MSERLIHYAAKPLTMVESRDQPDEPEPKPRGLWFSVEGEDDWRSWCEAERFGLDRLACAHEIVLAGDAKILRLSDALDIDAFSERYRHPLAIDYTQFSIDWRAVAGEYHGIIIAPYVWERRLNGPEISRWYYGWDCASGCVWAEIAVAYFNLSQPA